MKTVVLQSNYIPWRGYFDLILEADLFVFYDEVQYTKNDWRNRNKIADKNGPFWLTIPIPKEAVKQKISEVQLPVGNWKEEHLKKIHSSYSKSLFYSEVFEMLITIFKREFVSLSSLNQAIIVEICKKAGIKTEFKNSADFTLANERLERLIDLLKQCNCSTYISGPSAKNYLKGNEHLFNEVNINLKYKEYKPYPVYQQNCPTYEPNISILDTLFHVGFADLQSYLKSE